MRLLPRDSSSLSGIAASLSLAVANYKPIPQLPTSTSNSSTANGANQLMPVGVAGGKGSQQVFQVQSSSSASAYDQSHPIDQWGEVSVLYVSNSSNTNGNRLQSQSTVGPGNCPVATSYTPTSPLPAPTFATFDPVQANIYRYRQQQGVNLGSWFVQEGWMESNFMSCATGSQQAEFDLLSGFGNSSTGIQSATAYMEQHWDTWITENDFLTLAQKGINTVRIPIGYWSVGPYFTQNSPFAPYADVYYYSWRYIARAINWAAKYNIGVLVDLHGAYGSQNGQPHSGLSNGKVQFYTTQNMQLTTNLLVWLAGELSNVTNVIGIELLNEPVNNSKLWPWYYNTMNLMRQAGSGAKTLPLYFHNAFNLAQGTAFVANRTDFVVQDDHSYFVYTSQDTSMSASQHTSQIQGSLSTSFLKASNASRRNLVIGEWSCALAPSSLQGSSNPNAAEATFCKTQENVYRNAAAGWMFWAYKMQGCSNNGGWCFQQAIQQFLPGAFDSWGLMSKTQTFFRSISNSTASQAMPSFTNSISRIAMPLDLNTNSFKVQVNSTADSSNDDNDSIFANIDTSNVDVNVAGFLGMMDGKTASSLKSTSISSVSSSSKSNVENKEEEEGARIGMTSHAGESLKRRGVGSVAARAGELTRRAASNVQLASQYGYNDGFASARYFAANGGLSRIGFAVQYRADSYRARIAANQFARGNLANYQQQFLAGITAAESLIAQSISSNPTVSY